MTKNLDLNIKIKDFLFPFENLTHYLTACNIIKMKRSDKIDNMVEMTQTINTLNKSNIPLFAIRNFVHRIIASPATYGFEFIKNFTNHTAELYKLNQLKQIPTRIVTPQVQVCVFCKDKDVSLSIKPIRLAKETMLYTKNSIGIYSIKFCNFNHSTFKIDY